MLYQKSLTIPANTAEADAEEAILELTIGVSTKREVHFFDGCADLVHVRVEDAGWQIMPWTREEWLTASGETITDESNYPIVTKPKFFRVYGYNEDTVNDHTVTLRVTMREGKLEEFKYLQQFINSLRGL